MTARTARDPSPDPSCGSRQRVGDPLERSGTYRRSRSIVSARTSAIVRPCGSPNMPPMAWPSECSAPQSEMFMREARQQARAGHVRARVVIGAVADDADERPAGEPGRLERDAVAHGRRGPHDDGGDRLRQRVDPRHRGDPGREPPREHRVDERVLGAQERACDAGLRVGRVVGDDGASRDLRAGAGRRRHAHERDGGRGVGHLAAGEAQVRARPGRRRAGRPWRCPWPIRRRSRRRRRSRCPRDGPRSPRRA